MKKYLGIDIGGTTAKCAIVLGSGEILKRKLFNTGHNNTPENFLSELFDAVSFGMENGISGVGISCVGIIGPTGDFFGGHHNMPYLAGLNLKKIVSEKFNRLDVEMCNDAKAMARGEMWLGAGKNIRNFFCLALGTGIGGAIVLDSRVLEGSHFRAAEIAYIDYRSAEDFYELRVSTKCVTDIAAQKAGLNSVDGFAFFDKVRQNNPLYVSVFDEWVRNIAAFAANIIITLDVEKIIIGGGVSTEKDILIPKLMVETENFLPPEFRGQTEIVAARCGNDAAILGAVEMLIPENEK